MASSITIKCDKCCGATCQTCGFESEDLVCTNQPDTVAISHPFYKGDTCNGRIVREDLDCAECVKCNRDNYDWVPDESTICENESFIQERGGDYPECKMFQDSIGTKNCEATCENCNLYSEGGFCSGIPDHVSIGELIPAGRVCNGFIAKQDLNCFECVKCNRDNYDWVPDESTVCEGESFIQERGGDYPECKMFQDWIGTKDCQPPKDATCEDCGYYSDGGFCSGIPDHVAITQYFNPKETCGEKQFAEFTACFECVKCNRDNYPWEPDPSTKCLGVEFQQTKKGDYPECTIVRIEFGTSTDEGCNYWT